MSGEVVYQGCNCVEGCISLHTGIEILGLPLDKALEVLGDNNPAIEYTRRIRDASDSGTPRVVRVRNGILTVAFFNDALKEDNV